MAPSFLESLGVHIGTEPAQKVASCALHRIVVDLSGLCLARPTQARRRADHSRSWGVCAPSQPVLTNGFSIASGKSASGTDAHVHMDIRLKRAYEPAGPGDGYRVLIDRLWPRGLSMRQAKLDDWQSTVAPSTSLRQWFGHEPSRFEEFRQRYIEELRNERPALTALRRRARKRTLTLIYSAHDVEHNDAVVLAEVLRRGLPKERA